MARQQSGPLLTGTALVPAPEFTLAADDQVSTALTGLGRLTNVVEVVGLRSGPPT